EKQEAINRVSAELVRVQAQINAEHTAQGVKTIKDDAITTLSRINAQVVEKESARNAIEQKATQQTQFINNNDNATDEEKEVAKNLLEASKIKTISSINQAQTNAQVDNAKNTGMDEMSLIHPATTTKTDAKTALDQKAQQQDTIINGNNDATDEEKAKARELVEQAKTEA
ncbi:DUF1542 domain-containing protein, partial [Staphylococcus hominis]|uniref:DUF1542 domain-containing protein n=1 Tax=Staphylococcus hominis TaxID=1290 RepID=UPI0010398F36